MWSYIDVFTILEIDINMYLLSGRVNVFLSITIYVEHIDYKLIRMLWLEVVVELIWRYIYLSYVVCGR